MSYIKIQANQATISPTQNLLDFEVQDYIKGINMEKSFININYTIDTTEVAPATGIGVHNFVTLFNGIGVDKSNGLFNSCLVRNVSLTAQRGGQLESIQRADLLNQTVQQFTKNIGDIQGELHESILNLPFEFNYGSNQARNLVTEGTMGNSTDVTRYEREGVMRVNLKDVLGLGSSVLNLEQLGALRLHMEANLNKFTIKEVPCFTDAVPPVIAGGLPEYWISNEGAQAGDANPSELLFFGPKDMQTFLSKKNCPFHLGMKVNFVITGAGNTNTTVEAIIKEMIWQTEAADAGPPIVPAGARVLVKFSNAILNAAVAGAAIDTIAMYPVYATPGATMAFTKAELVVKTVMSPPVARGLRYRTYATTQDFAGGSTTFNRSYEVPGNAVASLVCFDSATQGTEFSSSKEVDLNAYQLYVDNVGQTDRPVTIRTAAPFSKSPLHGIYLEKTLEIMGLPYKNNLDTLPKIINGLPALDQSEIIPESEIFTAEAQNRVVVLPVMYEATGARKILNIDLVKDKAGSDLNLVVFSQVERTIDY